MNVKSSCSSELPLSGLRVIEVTHAWAGPLCGMLLADMGAEVIKIEPVDQKAEARGGFPYHASESVIFMMTHRNKKSVTLDLKSAKGREIFLSLVKSADVLIQNMRPGSLKKMGLDYDGLSAINPRLIYTSVTGYGHLGPKKTDAGVDQVAIAVTGLAATTMDGSTGKPVALGTPICDYVAAMWACHGTLCALNARVRTGVGQAVDTSLLEAGMSLMIGPLAMQQYYPDYTGYMTNINGPSEFFLCDDARYVSLFASYPALWDRFVKVPEFAHLGAHPSYASRDSRTKNVLQLNDALDGIFRTKPSDYWLDALNRAGVPISRVNTIEEAMEEPQTQALGIVREQDHPTAGRLQLMGVPVTLSKTPGTLRTPAPLLGEHTREVLQSLGVGNEEFETLLAESVITDLRAATAEKENANV